MYQYKPFLSATHVHGKNSVLFPPLLSQPFDEGFSFQLIGGTPPEEFDSSVTYYAACIKCDNNGK
jgi:hypothetical protein